MTALGAHDGIDHMGELTIIRHGETEWSRTGRHTGLSDIPLTAVGEQQAKAAASLLTGSAFKEVLVSPLARARETARLAGLQNVELEPDLREWDYGGYEGIKSAEIREGRPDWYLWRDGVIPGTADHPGESVEQVGARVDRVLARLAPVLESGDAAVVAHGHVLRVLTARWLGLAPAEGRLFRLDTATVSVLGFEHGRPVMLRWNSR
jgi:probable phosphoglycerate mutase